MTSSKDRGVRVFEVSHVPDDVAPGAIYRLAPQAPDERFYWERVDRNIGWVTRVEQERIRHSVIGIAGCGGMGGLIAATFLRAGAGEVRIADCEVFDASNINRQFAAKRGAVGVSKALETARDVRRICDDTTLVVFPQGITESTVASFLEGCDIVFDEIEFFAIGARVLLHQEARRRRVTILNSNTVGFRTYCFKFTAESMTVEEALGVSYEQACELERLVRDSDTSPQERQRARDEIISRIARVFGPEIPEYGRAGGYSTRDALFRRLTTEGKASIIGTNPVMAAGFAANRGLLEMLWGAEPAAHVWCKVPVMPGYLSFDAAQMEVRTHTGAWWPS